MTSKEFEYPNKLDNIFDKLNLSNLRTVLVGGYVRDFYLQIDSKDIDIEVYGLDDITQLQSLLQEFGKIDLVGKSFGVCKLSYDGLDLDFSMPRVDEKISSGHKGFKTITKKELDFKTAASRRDFTINSIGFCTKNKQILDPYNGLQDIEAGLLKIVDSASFIEDPLRVFRAMGFISRFKLVVEKNTLEMCTKMVVNNMLRELSKERIYEEFKKLFLKSSKPSLGLNFLKDIDATDFFTELQINNVNFNFTLKSLDAYASKNNFKSSANSKTNIKLSLVLLCYKLTDENIYSFIEKISNEKNLAKEIQLIINNLILLENYIDTYTLKKMATKIKFSEIFRLSDALGFDIKNIKKEVIDLGMLNNKIPNLIQGRDLISLGLKPSDKFANIINEAYENQLHSKFDNKGDAINFVRENLI